MGSAATGVEDKPRPCGLGRWRATPLQAGRLSFRDAVQFGSLGPAGAPGAALQRAQSRRVGQAEQQIWTDSVSSCLDSVLETLPWLPNTSLPLVCGHFECAKLISGLIGNTSRRVGAQTCRALPLGSRKELRWKPAPA